MDVTDSTKHFSLLYGNNFGQLKFDSTSSCGLYYKHIKIVNDDSSVINKLQVSLTDYTRVIIYNRNLFIIQATGINDINLFFFTNKLIQKKQDCLSLQYI